MSTLLRDQIEIETSHLRSQLEESVRRVSDSGEHALREVTAAAAALADRLALAGGSYSGPEPVLDALGMMGEIDVVAEPASGSGLFWRVLVPFLVVLLVAVVALLLIG